MKLPVLALILSVVPSFTLDDASPKVPPRDHANAIENFRKIAKGGFLGKWSEVESAFEACFRPNDPAADFGNLFATATRHEKIKHKELGDVLVHTWEIKRGKDDTTYLIVHVGFEPPVVVRAFTKSTW